MNPMTDVLKGQLLAIVAPHGQEHVLAFWERLGADERQALAAQVRAIDFPLIAQLTRAGDAAEDIHAAIDRATPPPAFRLDGMGNRFSAAEACRCGQAALAEGRCGVILVAGGQGTRLGFAHPKGMFPIGPISRRSLFQVHVEKILAVARRYGVRIPLCLMTSPATHAETVEYFARHERFGLPAEDLTIFCQGTMPAVDAQSGKVLLDAPGHVFASPDGHGGMLAALARSGALAELRRGGVETLFYFQVDNPLVDVLGAGFLGYHLLSNSELSTQVVRKQEPLEKVGNVVAVDGQLRIIEYSDLPDDAARRRNPDGTLAIWAGSIAVHAMQASFLDRMASPSDSLPLHRARKKVPYIDATGCHVEPAAPNAIKFERFIFDLLPAAARAIVVEIDPQRCFAPLKNASGDKQDTPEIVRAQMVALHAEWLGQAGAKLDAGVEVEINPLFALDAAELAKKIKPGVQIVESTYFH